MAQAEGAGAIRWYRSFYFRIGFSFVTFVVGLLVLQTLFFNIVLERTPLRGSPNIVVAVVAADLTAALTNDPAIDIDEYLKAQYATSQPIYVVLDDGVAASNRSEPLPDAMRRYVEGLLRGSAPDLRIGAAGPAPFVTAPIQLRNVLRGIVVLPPARPPSPIVRDISRLASIPGAALLALLTMIAAAFIFEPARRRLKMLRDTSRRLGAGDLSARAPVSGGDEVAELAAAFNRMAADLAARDAALRESDRLRRQMLADVSHELKTPLTAMRGYVETLRRDDLSLGPERRERYLETLERETMRLDRIVKDLVDLARLEHSAGDFDIRVFDIRRVFEHVLDRHSREIERRGVTVHVEVEAAADQIVADPARIEQVVENLFANALRHVPDGGAIELSARVERDAYVLAIVDSGGGIPAEHLPLVFERFYKVDASRANGAGGSGLGLSISKAIVERHSGRIAVASRPGRTVFTIHLPREAEEAGPVS
jgi:signal transduction histidine kinase